MGLARTIVRKIGLPTAMALGIDKLLLARKKNSLLVVNFHGVRSKTHTTINNRHIPVAEFEKIIVYLAKNFSIVPLSELMRLKQTGTVPDQKTLALTFDDGYLNNFENALPILKKHQVPATFYVISAGLQDDTFMAWPDALDLYLRYNHQQHIQLNQHTFLAPDFKTANDELALAEYLKTLGADTPQQVDDWIKNKPELHKKRKEHAELLQLVTATQLKHYANEPLLEIGSHSHSHLCMAYISEAAAIEEFTRSKALLEACIEKPVQTFAFPDGSYQPQSIDLALKCGYTTICAVTYKTPSDYHHPNLVRRFTISNSTTFESNILRLAKDFDAFAV